MRLARPPGGFKIHVSPAVKALVEQAITETPAFEKYWEDIKDRLRFVAHVEGFADERFIAGSRMWVAAADDERGVPRVKLLYQVLGERVRILVAQIG